MVDYPNSKKARKVFLCLFVGGGGKAEVPKGLDGEEVEEEGKRVVFERRREKEKRKERKHRSVSGRVQDLNTIPY